MIHDFSKVFDTDNPEWLKVLEIFERNECFDKKKTPGRALHHKFPRSFSKLLNEDVDNDLDNIVSLPLEDHFMVHYYYYRLAKEQFKARMALAFTYMMNCKFEELSQISPDIAEKLSKEYAENESEILKETGKARIGSKRTDETIENMKAAWVKRKENGLNYIPTEETKQKQSQALLGRKKSAEHCKHISEARTGMKFTKEHCINQQESRNKTLAEMTEDERKEKFGKAMRGKHNIITEETKRKISQAKMGHTVSDEARRKMSEKAKGRKLKPETIEKMKQARKGLKYKIVDGKRVYYREL